MQRRALIVAAVLLLGCDGDPDVPIDPQLGPKPTCELPPRTCRGSQAHCRALVRFAPTRGVGYVDMRLADERTPSSSSSYLRRDLMMLVKYAAARVECEAAAWPGVTGPLALGDMSQRDGAIPGTWADRPRHLPGTHEDGDSIDLAYYQLAPDHVQRAICPHHLGAVDQFHCVAPPTTLDAQRTALFIGALFEEPFVRVVGVDGLAAPPIVAALAQLCRARWITAAACRAVRLASEREDTGRGWYHMHHHHLHVGTYAP